MTGPVASRLEEKFGTLKARIADLGSVAVALSGGIDSTLLLYVCHDVLGDRVLAVTSTSVTTPAPDLNDARSAARELGVRHILIDTHELDIPDYSKNSPSRCFFCKDELYRKVWEVARQQSVDRVVDGSNADDSSEHRPGMDAARKLEVSSPLLDAGLGKEEIRSLARRYGISIWRKPASACLSSRFPYGTKIVRADVERVAQAEECLRELGFVGLRVRHHGDVARLEVSPTDIARLTQPDIRERVVSRLKTLGYLYVAVDLEGYRTGSMNDVLGAGAFQA